MTHFDVGQAKDAALRAVGAAVTCADHDRGTELVRADFLSVATEEARLHGEFT